MRQVVWSQSAQDDYLEILRHIAIGDPIAAERVMHAIANAGQGLGEFATGHPGRMSGIYYKSIPRLPYMIAYCLADSHRTVAILHVTHVARDWNEDG